MAKKAVLALVVTASALGCGDPEHGVVDPVAARACIDRAAQLPADRSTMDGFAAAGDLLGLTCAGPMMVAPRDAVVIHGLRGLGCERLTVSGAATCSATECQFVRYGCAGFGSDELDGTLAATGDSFTVDLTFDWAYKTAGKMSWTIDGSMTIAAGAIEGRVHSHGVGDPTFPFNATDADVDVQLDYRAIVLDGDRCPIGGSMRATVRYASAKDSVDFDVAGEVSFGPTCGDARAARRPL